MNPESLAILDKDLRRDEGVEHNYYYDIKGIKSIAVGHNCEADPLPIGWTPPLTDDQINKLLNHDLSVLFAGLDLHIPWWKHLNDPRQRVIANMGFNLGVDGLLKFHNTLKYARLGQYALAASEILDSAAARELPERYGRLSEIMKTGVEP